MRKLWFIALLGLLSLRCAEEPKYPWGRVAFLLEERFAIAPAASDHILFGEKTRALLTAAGFEVIEPRAGVSTLKTTLVAEPVLTKYRGGLEGYTGAEVMIVMELIEAETSFADTLLGSALPLDIIGLDTTYANPENAPFAEAIERAGYFESLGEMIGRRFGPAPLISAAATKSVWVERGHRKIPFRIESYACSALRSVTGKDYGDDAEVWDLWWRQKGRADSAE